MRPTKLAGMLLREKGSRQARRVLEDRYLVSPSRSKLVCEAAACGLREAGRLTSRSVGLYLGVPFCPTRCAYCSFVSASVGRYGDLIEPYTRALLGEIARRGALAAELGFVIDSVYMGGGTPTTLSAEQMDRVLTALERSFDLSQIREFTVEAGRPDTIDLAKLQVLKKHGVDRISINPQSMQPQVLERAGRPHSPEDVERAFAQAREVGFRAINADLIAGLAGGETPSLELFRREEGIPSEQSVAEMIDRGSRLIIDRGYHPYYLYRQKYMAGGFENVGWALDGMDSVYNICIMEELCSILSLGCGGVTKLTDRRSPRRISNPKYPKEYIARSEEEWDAADEKLRTWVRGQQEREGSHVF